MMAKHRQIRQGTWETNSSSTHSVTIMSGPRETPLLEAYCPEEEGVFELVGGEFGWDREEYTDFDTKLKYAYTHVCPYGDLNKGTRLDMLESVLRDNIPGIKEFRYNTGYYYIDHQSAELCDDIYESYDTLETFLFSKNSELRTDNDNDW